MIDPVTLQSISILISSLGMIIALVYYTQTLKNTSKARQRELIHQRFQGLSKEYIRTLFELSTRTDWETVEEYMEKYGRWENPEAGVDFTYIASIYNNMGVLYKYEDVDPEFLFELYPASAIIRLWEQFEPVIQVIRGRTQNPNHLKPLELLYLEARRRYPNTTSWNIDQHGLDATNQET